MIEKFVRSDSIHPSQSIAWRQIMKDVDLYNIVFKEKNDKIKWFTDSQAIRIITVVLTSKLGAVIQWVADN